MDDDTKDQYSVQCGIDRSGSKGSQCQRHKGGGHEAFKGPVVAAMERIGLRHGSRIVDSSFDDLGACW